MAENGCDRGTTSEKGDHCKDLLYVEPSRVYEKLFINGEKKLSSKPPNICNIGKSDVLTKVKAFLPMLQESNRSLETFLQSNDKNQVDIEHIGDAKSFVEMNIGFIEERNSNASSFETVFPQSPGGISSSDSDSDTNCAASLGDVGYGFNIGEVTASNFRTVLPTYSKRPYIKEINNDNGVNSEHCEKLDGGISSELREKSGLKKTNGRRNKRRKSKSKKR